MEDIILQNGELTVTLSTLGAELRSILLGGKEQLWQGAPTVWAGRAPLLFPVCGGLHGDAFTHAGHTYPMQKHGYIRFCTFTVEKQSETSVTFFHKSSVETKQQYPFDYALRVTYTLRGRSIDVDYAVENLSGVTMPFSIGAHEGHATPGGIEHYVLEFEQPETLDTWELTGNFLSGATRRVLENERVLPLSYADFAVDALVFKGVRSRKVTLRDTETGYGRTVEFNGFPYLVLWSKPGASFLCIEPWCGVQESVDFAGDLFTREGNECLPAGETFTRRHTITL